MRIGGAVCISRLVEYADNFIDLVNDCFKQRYYPGRTSRPPFTLEHQFNIKTFTTLIKDNNSVNQ